MDIERFEEITGTTVSSSQQTRYTALINKTRRILESMLGYTLDPAHADDNQYIELGKTATECPSPHSVDLNSLVAPDAVQGAYRLYKYYPKHINIVLDPATAVYKIKLVNGNVTYKTLESHEYRVNKINGIITSVELIPSCWDTCTLCLCDSLQLAIDAEYLWQNSVDIPEDLLSVWADMVTYHFGKNNIKSETLGTHSYTKFSDTKAEDEIYNKNILQKYVGPNGSLYRIITI